MITLLPILMIKNEERFIERVLTPLANVFPQVIVADTGSTDSTLEQVAKVKNIHLVHYPNATPEELAMIRQYLQDIARGFGATHTMIVDGDEIYPTEYARFIHDNPMPENMKVGLVIGEEIAELPNGEWWKYDVRFNRMCVMSVDTQWQGIYPFEGVKMVLAENPELNYYWKWDNPLGQYYHLHTMRRSSKDEDAHRRVEKKYQFSMRDRPDLKPKTFWLKNEFEYTDGL
jgi:glycosyltransferase involved in cell wall biosynthesis